MAASPILIRSIFCIQARGSLSEIVNHLTDAQDEGYIDLVSVTQLRKKAKELELILNGYIHFLRTKKSCQP
jgi:four helix bundle protein